MRKNQKAVGAAVLAALIGCGIMLMLPGISESTVAAMGTATAVGRLAGGYVLRQSVADSALASRVRLEQRRKRK